MPLLAIETSCDETAAAVFGPSANAPASLLASVTRSQEAIHGEFSGVVPEIASRAHCAWILPIIERALHRARIDLEDLKAVAVTVGPGLLGSLLVGLSAAKGLCLTLGVPLVGIDHLEAHIAAACIGRPQIDFPHLALVVSGGHSIIFLVHDLGKLEVIGNTCDDAVGEAYDKVAVLLGLGYPGGPHIDRLANDYQGARIPLPVPLKYADNLNFSFSGLKTAVANLVRKMGKITPPVRAQVAASFQWAAVEALLSKLAKAAERYPEVRQVVIAGGVARNSELRKRITADPNLSGHELLFPTAEHCTDNAAMIAALGWRYHQAKRYVPLDIAPYTSVHRSSVTHNESRA